MLVSAGLEEWITCRSLPWGLLICCHSIFKGVPWTSYEKLVKTVISEVWKYYLWTVCSPKEHAGNLWAGSAEGQGCFGGGRGSTMSPRRVVNGTRQSCGMMAFGGHDGERCHNSTWCSRAALAGSRCVYKKWGNHSCWQPWEIPPWLSLWIAGTAAENSGFKKKKKLNSSGRHRVKETWLLSPSNNKSLWLCISRSCCKTKKGSNNSKPSNLFIF